MRPKIDLDRKFQKKICNSQKSEHLPPSEHGESLILFRVTVASEIMIFHYFEHSDTVSRTSREFHMSGVPNMEMFFFFASMLSTSQAPISELRRS